MTPFETKRWLEELPANEAEARAARALAGYAEATAEVGPHAATRVRLARSAAAMDLGSRRRPPTVLLAAATVVGVGLAAAAVVPWRTKPTVVSALTPSSTAPQPVVARPVATPLAPSATASVAPEIGEKPVPAPQPRASSSALELESRALASAVAALRRDRNPDRALALLDEYRAAFPRGALSLEASLVRVDALMALGRRREALAVLERLPVDKMPRGGELRKLRDNLRQGR